MPRLSRVLLVLALLVAACNIERRHGVGPESTVTQVFVMPDTVTLDPLGVWTFGVYGRNATGDSLPVSVQWSTSAGSITQSALYTADSSENDVTVTASVSNGSLSGTAIVHKRRVVQLILQPATASLLTNQTQQLSTRGVRNTGDTIAVTVTYVATGGTITSSGLYTAGGTPGSFKIIATRRALADTAFVTVTNPPTGPVASVTVTPATKTLRIGTAVQLGAATRDSMGALLTGRSITWSSDAPAVATVSASGLVSAVAAGTATITATSEGKSGTAAITVTVVPVASVSVTPSPGSVNIGSTVQLSAVTKDSAGRVLTGRVITWSSSATGVGTVSTGGLVSGVAAGSTTITAASEGKSGSSVVTVIDPSAVRAGKYVSPTGSSTGDGTVGRPWDIVTALAGAGGRIVPGDTVWVRGGLYHGTLFSSLRGSVGAPIVVRAYPGERPIIDGNGSTASTFVVDGANTIYWGLEVTNSGLARQSDALALRPAGVYVRNATSVKLVNFLVHDTGHGTYVESTAHDIEIYGWVIYDGGSYGSSRGDGHGIYIRNDGTTRKLVRDNVIFNQFGFGIHGYAEGGDLLKHMVFEGNVAFNNGELAGFSSPNLIVGGQTDADADTVRNNMFYFIPGWGPRNIRLGYGTALNGTGLFEGNYAVGGATTVVDVTTWQNLTVRNNTLLSAGRVVALADPTTSRYSWSGNQYYHDPAGRAWGFGATDYTLAGWQQTTGLGASDAAQAQNPTQPQIFVRPNQYEPGRANVIVYNWGRQSSVSVDLSSVLAVGQKFEIRNVQDLFGTPVQSGTYAGGTVLVPMGGVTPPQPLGGSPVAPVRTGPDFDVFLVLPIN